MLYFGNVEKVCADGSLSHDRVTIGALIVWDWVSIHGKKLRRHIAQVSPT